MSSREFARTERTLTDLSRRILALLPRHKPRGEAAVFILSGAKMKALKKKFLKQDMAFVDVLAFPEPAQFPHPDHKKAFLGEVYLNSALVKDRPRLVYLLIHGILHLLGYRHEKRNDIIRMERLEKRLLALVKQKNLFSL